MWHDAAARRTTMRTVSMSRWERWQRAPDIQIWGTLVAPPRLFPASRQLTARASSVAIRRTDTLWRAGTPVVGPGGGVEWSKRPSGATRWGGKGLSAASRRHEIRSERQCAGLDELYAAYTETTSPHVPPRPPLGFPCALLSSRPHWSLCICADR